MRPLTIVEYSFMLTSYFFQLLMPANIDHLKISNNCKILNLKITHTEKATLKFHCLEKMKI